MKKFTLILGVGVLMLLSSCDNGVEVLQPIVDPSGVLATTDPVPNKSKPWMEGIYTVESGSSVFGKQVVLKWSNDNLSIFTSKNAGYAVLKGGEIDSVFYFEGYWRFRTSTETGVLSLQISKSEGGAILTAKDSTGGEIVLRGSFGNGTQPGNAEVILRFLRPFSDFVKQNKFYILAHRGGGRNSDYLGVSENTLQIIKQSEGYGANGIEIDVKLSSDGIPFICHDDDINLRTTQKGVLWGNIEQFTWNLISAFVTLKNGEKIPSLIEALDYIIEETSLSFIWLDLKSSRNEIPIVTEIVLEMLKKGYVKKRDLQIVIGLPSEDKLNNLVKVKDFTTIPTLCELDINSVRKANSKYWAPRWTLGTQTPIVLELQNEGRGAFVWTIDDPAFIESFITEGKFNGMLTNYPSLVAYYHYTR